MTNELFTQRNGKQVAVPAITVPLDVITTIMALQEDYAARGMRLSLTGLLIDLIDKGKRQTENQWRNGERSKNFRNTSAQIARLLDNQGRIRPGCEAELQEIALRNNLVKGTRLTPVEEQESEEELRELEALTAPNGNGAH